jgi:hypothetical protein
MVWSTFTRRVALMVYSSMVFIYLTLYADYSDWYSHDCQDRDNRRDVDVGDRSMSGMDPSTGIGRSAVASTAELGPAGQTGR